jgi:hypothetical protein
VQTARCAGPSIRQPFNDRVYNAKFLDHTLRSGFGKGGF